MDCRPIIEKLRKEQDAQMEELRYLLEHLDEESSAYLRAAAAEEAVRHFGRKIYLRGLIEFTNYCKNDCYYCGIRRSNRNAQRYRLTEEDILACCKEGYELGFRTFVLQGGEDPYFTDEKIVEIVKKIRAEYPSRMTLSTDERTRKTSGMKLLPMARSRPAQRL